ncbi:hypothetical protein HF313_25670 [Massilia atriviolacea]|uniref:hypothetical protein n=1 Tax=Massilia atriviolacea TaxID=2495579 RepID=UPI0013E0880E|nr:hypothetical protein [Massilia atriviolacea]
MAAGEEGFLAGMKDGIGACVPEAAHLAFMLTASRAGNRCAESDTPQARSAEMNE